MPTALRAAGTDDLPPQVVGPDRFSAQRCMAAGSLPVDSPVGAHLPGARAYARVVSDQAVSLDGGAEPAGVLDWLRDTTERPEFPWAYPGALSD